MLQGGEMSEAARGRKTSISVWCASCLRFKGKAAGGVASGPEGRRRGVQPYRVDNQLASRGRRQPRRTGTGPQDGGRWRMQGEGRRSAWSGRRGNGSASGSLPLGRTPSGQEAATGGKARRMDNGLASGAAEISCTHFVVSSYSLLKELMLAGNWRTKHENQVR